MNNCNIILGNTQNLQTWEIISSLLEELNLPQTIYWYLTEKIINLSSDGIRCINLSDVKDEGDSSVYLVAAENQLAQQMHKIYQRYEQKHFTVDRIISIVDASFFTGRCPVLLDAMAHFADLLLINNVSPISEEQRKAYIAHCKKEECYPLPIKTLTEPDVHCIRELHDTQARRMTLIFDDISPIDLLDESDVGRGPFTIPTLDQCDKYLQQDDQGRYLNPIESLR